MPQLARKCRSGQIALAIRNDFRQPFWASPEHNVPFFSQLPSGNNEARCDALHIQSEKGRSEGWRVFRGDRSLNREQPTDSPEAVALLKAVETKMASAGLSLLGFMGQQDAMAHLLAHCIPASRDFDFLREWQAARVQKGPPMLGGNPEILDVPEEHRTYLQTLSGKPWFSEFISSVSGGEFKLVEIDPLLTFHFMLDLNRSANRCSALSQTPSVSDLLQICLPATFPNEPVDMMRLPDGQNRSLSVGAFLLRARSLNVRVIDAGYFQADNKVGIQFGMPVPLVQVVRFNGRCYLHDGLHRAVGVRQKGATHIPCLFRDVESAAQVGIRANRSTFSLQVLESADPPTVGHFTQGRAHHVQLKRYSRVVHVTWAEYEVADE